MKAMYIWVMATMFAFSAGGLAHADLVVQKDGTVIEGKILSRDAKGLSVQVEGKESQTPLQVAANGVVRVVQVDEKGAAVAEAAGMNLPAKRPDPKWNLPEEPVAPPIGPTVGGPTYYVIPLHGVVGETYLSDVLEKSLADAAKRKPTVVVLDINSPGGKVSEAEAMVKTLHHYNKELRIVALVDQDLSASAITSLSVRTIYMKSTGTIGAATAFDTSDWGTPEDIQEKFQSAWRAVARNSAEEGGHEPLLAEAMIDNTLELHVETVDGKKVVTEGHGPNMLTKPGKILTLTSREAVNCGLAEGITDDFDELGQKLNLKGWKECPGLGAALADYVTKRREVYEQKTKEIQADLRANLAAAESAAPSEGPVMQHISVGPAAPDGLGGAGSRITLGQVRMVTPQLRAQWNNHSLAAVVAFQKMEQDLQDEIALANAVGEKGLAKSLQESLAALAEARARLYSERNKYAGDPLAVTAGTAPPLNLKNAPLPVKLSDSVKQAVVQKNYKTWQNPIRKMPSDAVEDIAPDGGVLIGLRCGMGRNFAQDDIIASLQPVYLTAKGIVLGPVRGDPNASPVIDLVARDGYAVGSAKMQSWLRNTTGLQLHFVRIGDGQLNPADSYESNTIGKLEDPFVMGNAMPAIGILSKADGPVLEVGLLTVSPPVLKPITAGTAPPLNLKNAPLPAKLSALAKQAVDKRNYSTGKSLGVGDSSVVVDTISGGGVLIGLRCGRTYFDGNIPIGTDRIASVQPIYLTARGVVMGVLIGNPDSRPVTDLVARDGYAVAGWTIDANQNGLKLRFMRIGDDGLIPTDSYESDVLGKLDKPTTLDGAMPIVGVSGQIYRQAILTFTLLSMNPPESNPTGPLPGGGGPASSPARIPVVATTLPRNPSTRGGSTAPPVRPSTGPITASNAPPPLLKNAPLPAKICDAVKQAVARKNYQPWEHYTGSTPKDSTDDVAVEGGVLLGLRCGLTSFAQDVYVTSLQPIYLTARGVVLGQVNGNASASPVVDLVARDGYVVGGAKIEDRGRIYGLQLRFVRIGDGRMNPLDAYESDTIGKLDQPYVMGNGMPVVGITTKLFSPIILKASLLTLNPPEPKPLGAMPAARVPAAPLPAALVAAVKDALARKTYQVGGCAGSSLTQPDFQDLAPDGGILIGFRCGKKQVGNTETITSIQPIYRTTGGEALGHVHGDAAAAPVEDIKAPPGYAVGAVTVGGGQALDALTVTFMKIGDPMLLVDDAYVAHKIGTGVNPVRAPNVPSRTKTFGGDGTPVIGISGKAGDQGKLALGLVFLTPTDMATGIREWGGR